MNSNEAVKVVELRNYLLKPGRRDEFIDYFAKHFVESQNSTGGFVLGGYQIESEPDRFFWLRGFSSMNARSRFLPEFYGGEIWQERGPRANAMMLEWDHVFLLKPLGEIKVADFASDRRVAVIDFYFAFENKIGELIEFFQTAKPSSATSWWTSETAENDFPRLPVRQDANLLAAISAYKDEADYRARKNDSNLPKASGNLIAKHERLILSRAF